MLDLTPAPSPLMKACAFVARWSLALLLFAWFLFAAGWGALHLLIVPRIGELRPQLETTASRILGVAVRVEAVAAYSIGMIPAFELTNVSLHDQQGREALRLPRVLVSLSPRSVLALKFEQLYIDRPTLNIRRATDGKIFVAGLDFSKGSKPDGGVMDLLFSQPELVIRHGAVVWTDELRSVPALALRDVDLVLRNRSRRHDLRLDATPPPDWGDRFGLMARFEQPFLSMDGGRWQDWSGQAYGNFSRVDLSQLKRYADVGVDLQRGRGALRAWVDIRRGRMTGATADVALADAAITLDPTLKALELLSLSGRLAAKFSPGTVEVSTTALEFDTADGMRWPGGNIELIKADGDAARAARGELVADRLDLAALTQIASRLPMGAQLHAALAQYAPKGLVERFKARWEGPVEAISKYEVLGRVQQFSVKEHPARIDPKPGAPIAPGSPGISGATVDFEFNESAGKARLALQDGTVVLPGVFEEPVVPFAQLSGDVSWQTRGDKIQVQVADLRFSNQDAAGELTLKWRTSDPGRSGGGDRFPGELDLQGNLSRAEGVRVHRYLPLILDAQVRGYVRDAVQGGNASGVSFKVKGDLMDMPFANPKQGEFQINANIRNAQFAYLPQNYQETGALPWPALTQLSGELVIDRKSLHVKGANGLVVGTTGLQLSKAEGTIADLTRSTNVVVGLEFRGPLPEMLAVVNGSPIGDMTGQALTRATTAGNAELRLKLTLPLEALDKSSMQGALTLLGNDLQLSAETPRISRARGVVGFSESGFSINAVQARIFGGDARLEGGSIPPVASGVPGARAAATLSLRAQGIVSAEGLQQARELGIVARLAQYASGSAAYTATFGLRAGVPEISVSSSLAGLALNLPAPLGKSPDAAMPIRLDSSLVRESLVPAAGGRVRLQDRLVMDIARVGSFEYVRDLSTGQPQVQYGAIGVGLAVDESAPMPLEGVVANINLSSFDLDAWGAVLSQSLGASFAGLNTLDAAPGNGTNSLARSYLPTSLAVRARSLVAGGRKLRNVVVGGSRDGPTWRANVDADELNGYVEYRQSSEAGSGRVFARLARLTLAPELTSDVERLLDDQPSTIPALDIVVDDLELRGKKLGRVEVEALNRAVGTRDGGVREWRLRKFDVITADAVFRATGDWVALNAQSATAGLVPSAGGVAEPRRTVMNFRLEINNSGDLLTRLGMRDVIRRGKGIMEGQVAWAGSPLTLDYPSLGGEFSVNVENGQFLKADPGLAKLLGVLSLQSLPRRLTLDFRDVFTEGFVFDFFRGDVKIDHGIASSNNLQMKGVNAAVLMDGQADLARETQDIKVVVVPELNAGTASLIASAINPAIGLGSFLAQLFLRRPLIEAATQEFHVDGSWLDPRIRRVDRKTGVAGAIEPETGASPDKKASEVR